MSFLDSLPENISVEEPIRVCASADLLPDGSFGKQWLLVTNEKVLIFTDGEVPTKRLELSLGELESPKVDPVVGGGILEVSRDGETIELVRYTNAETKKFSAIAKALEKWTKGEEAELETEEERRCPRCGLPLEEGTDVCPACLPKRKTLLRLVQYLVPHWKHAVFLSVMALISTALGLVPPYLNRPLIDVVLVPKDVARPFEERLSLLGILVLILLFSYILTSALSAAQGWLSAWLGNTISHDIRSKLYQHLQFLSLRFYDKRQLGTVISRVNQDTGRLQEFLVWGSQDLAINFLLLIGIGVVLFAMNWKLAFFALVPAPAVSVLSRSFWKLIRLYMHRFFHRWSRLNAILNESLSGLKIVKSFAQEPREVDRFSARSADLAVTGTQAERTWALLFSGFSVLLMVGTLLVWYVGGRDVLFGKMTLGTLMAFLMYVAMFYRPIRFMSQLINWSSRSITAAERVFEIFDVRPEIQDVKDAKRMPQIHGRVEFRNVTFGYEPNKQVLKNINFEVKPGEMIGLVGHSGAGKSTTINLLCRFYDVDEGEILIDGMPIRQIRLEDLRRQIGIVPQDMFLFSGTIAENIAYAKPSATREEIIRAAKVANAHDFILRKPDGYETTLGEGGGGLSAGEKQRIAIARAVLHNPRILILDEATSQVDVETEKQIQEAIAELVKGRTTIAIAHRLSTLKNADRLIVLKEGEIVEMGSHEELLSKEGEFHRLVQMYQEVAKVKAVER
ncbi:TPA: ABC transporter ATP-binding protein [Candidatus Poribacteria bacterium]|nr:ABC transporter ATP-binding protein [Candidatus Poribacteria bacterium]